MQVRTFMDNAKVMAKGQVTIPKDVRKVLGVSSGDKVTFVVEDNEVRLVNAAVFAMQIFQKQMQGEAEKAGLKNDDDVLQLIEEMRNEDN